MPSRFDTQLAADFDRSFSDFKETVIRRVLGDATKTENVEAVVNLDSAGAGGGLVTDETGQYIQADGDLELALDQPTTPDDTWIIRGREYKTLGEPVSEDGGSKTLAIVRRQGIRSRKPRMRR